MDIFYRKKLLISVNNVDELEKFIIDNKLYKNFKNFNINKHTLIVEEINKTNKINYKEVKVFLKKFLPDESNRSINFWLDRGYTYSESKTIVSDLQIKSNSFVKQEDIIHNTNIKYWLKKCGSEEEAKSLLSKRQSTFSSEKCINKYGDELGLEIFKNRQLKWRESLTKYDYNEFNHKSKLIKNLKEKFGENSFIDIINVLSYSQTHKNIITNIINSCENIDKLVNYLLNDLTINCVNDIKFIYQSKLLQSFYNLNETELKNEILSGLNITINKIGTKRLFDGKIYHSNGDYRIAKSLRENHIDFIYNMKYPYQNKTNYRCDFFLPNYEIYIEYFGLLKNNFNENTKIIYDYKEKMDLKILFCQENGLNLIYDINLNKLLTKINNKINEKQSI